MKVRFAVSVGTGPPDPDELASVCRSAEETGFDTLWFSDVPSFPLTEPLVGVAYASAVTRRVRLGVNVIPFGSTPYLVAHRLAQLDRLTAGRLLVTLVPGIDRQHPASLLDDVIPQLRKLWAGGVPVAPVQDPLEIWLGGSGPKAVRRAGRLADGWLGSRVTPEEAGRIRLAIEEEARAAGREIDPEHFGLSIGYRREEGRPALRRLIQALVDQGLSKFVVRPVAPVTDWTAELDWLAEAVLDLQT